MGKFIRAIIWLLDTTEEIIDTFSTMLLKALLYDSKFVLEVIGDNCWVFVAIKIVIAVIVIGLIAYAVIKSIRKSKKTK